jgi:hypothetical protein
MSMPTWEEVAEEAATDEFWEHISGDLHEDAVTNYLGRYGDAIESRVAGLIPTRPYSKENQRQIAGKKPGIEMLI